MKPGFQNMPVKISTFNGRGVTVLEPLIYVAKNGDTHEVAAGSTSDGASVPRLFWRVLPPFGKYWPAGLLHDAIYRTQSLSRKEADDLFFEAMESCGCSRLQCWTIYAAVRSFGWVAWKNNSKLIN